MLGKTLTERGESGWLAVMDGDYYGSADVVVMEVRSLTEPAGDFQAAVAAFFQRRRAATGA